MEGVRGISKRKGRYQKAAKATPIWPLVLMVVLLVGALCLVRLGSSSSEPQSETEPVEKLDGQIAIPGFESLTLKADSKKQEVVLSNPAENSCYFRISLLLSDGTVLWTSEEIAPGKTCKPLKLNQSLSAGVYEEAKLKYECFTMDSSRSALNGAEIKLTLRVQ